MSLPSRERELKPSRRRPRRRGWESLPSRERELKRQSRLMNSEDGKVAPFTGA